MASELARRVVELEDLILQLDSTFADLESAHRKEYLRRDLPRLRAEATVSAKDGGRRRC
jgi:hypothetical protein